MGNCCYDGESYYEKEHRERTARGEARDRIRRDQERRDMERREAERYNSPWARTYRNREKLSLAYEKQRIALSLAYETEIGNHKKYMEPMIKKYFGRYIDSIIINYCKIDLTSSYKNQYDLCIGEMRYYSIDYDHIMDDDYIRCDRYDHEPNFVQHYFIDYWKKCTPRAFGKVRELRILFAQNKLVVRVYFADDTHMKRNFRIPVPQHEINLCSN